MRWDSDLQPHPLHRAPVCRAGPWQLAGPDRAGVEPCRIGRSSRRHTEPPSSSSSHFTPESCEELNKTKIMLLTRRSLAGVGNQGNCRQLEERSMESSRKAKVEPAHAHFKVISLKRRKVNKAK